MSSFTNSEQLYGVLQAQVSGGYKNVATGTGGVLFSVIVGQNSGAGNLNTLSGGVVVVFDSVSGNTNPTGSGLPLLYFFNHGNQSGAGTAGNVAYLAPDLWAPQPFSGGLSVIISGAVGENVTLTYRKGI